MYKSDATRTSASWCLARHFSRSDAQIDEIVSRIIGDIETELQLLDEEVSYNPYLVQGALEFLCNLYKIGDRKKLAVVNEKCAELAEKVTETYENMQHEQLRNATIERLCVKLSGRIGWFLKFFWTNFPTKLRTFD